MPISAPAKSRSCVDMPIGVVMAEVGIQPIAKRKCECCDAAIPKWRNGRRVSRATRFCLTDAS